MSARSFAAAAVNFDGTLLEVTSTSPGAGVPGGNVTLFADTGLVDGFFDSSLDLVPQPIASDGALYSFDIHALAMGEGLIELSFVSASEFDPNNPAGAPLDATMGGALAFSILPEPSSATLALSGLVAWGLMRRRRRARGAAY